MNDQRNILSGHPITFLEFVWKGTANQRYLLVGVGFSVVQFIIFKILYPFPDFFSDSYSYIYAAHLHLDVSVWPIGYSKFLEVFHIITHSDTALVAFQYFFLQAAELYFFFSILYFFTNSVWTQRMLFGFIFINPLSLYLCNTINSDALFIALSILWVTQLLWILEHPRIYQLFTQAILLFLCFAVRNNAYYYPLVAILAFFLSSFNRKVKLIGIVLPFLFLIPFVLYTENEAYKLTGSRQFSLFTGWQLANNALYVCDKIELDSSNLPTREARELNRLTILFLSHVKRDEYRSYLESFVGNFFIKYPDAPLKKYFSTHYKSRDEMELIRSWGKASADFEPFGKYIIINHPVAYFRYFMWPNFGHYILPPLSHLERYNYGEDGIDEIARYWFHYPRAKVRCISHNLQSLLIVYVALFLLLNLYFLWQLGRFILKIYLGSSKIIFSAYWLVTFFLVCNLGFSVFATVNILRYQIVPMILLLTFGLLMEDYYKSILVKENVRSKGYSSQLTNRPIIN